MRARVFSSLVLTAVAAASPAAAQLSIDGTPGTNEPQSALCGLPITSTKDQVVSLAGDVYYSVVDLSGLTDNDVSFYFVDSISDIGTTAATMSPEQAKTLLDLDIKTPKAVVFAVDGCAITHSKDELAFVFAHELAHVKLKHYELSKYAALRWMEEVDAEFQDSQDMSYSTPADREAARRKFMSDRGPELKRRLADEERGLERQADQEALRILSSPKSPYRLAAGADHFRHVQDLTWAWGVPADPPQPSTHPPLAERISMIECWAAALKKE
jgi:hypothetical protein